MIQNNFNLAQFTRFGVGGPAKVFFQPENVGELKQFLSSGAPRLAPGIFILGLGSNVLIRDSGIDGAVIRLANFNKITVEGARITCGAFAALPALAIAARNAAISEMEFMIGIPGTIGGGIWTNAGCFGGEISDILISITAMAQNGEIVKLNASECGLSYRESLIDRGLILLEFELSGEMGDIDAIDKKMNEIIDKKNASQPTDAKTCGSTFKNATANGAITPAWKLITESGANKFSVGDAFVSPKHANFIINGGGATASQIYGLCEKIRRRVREHSGIILEYEIQIL